jgi:lipid II:glycine glycyltransferase (peptidoglycan interpeptide bridge formation enzyme)
MAPQLPELERWRMWDSFLEATPRAGFMQSSWYADFRSCSGIRCFGILLKEEEIIVGGAMVMTLTYAPGHCFYYISDGPVVPEDEPTAREVFENTVNLVAKHRVLETETVSHLRIEPRWRSAPSYLHGFQPLTCPDPYVEPRDTLLIDLRPSEAAILAQMKPKGRYNIRLAQRHGVRVVEDQSERGVRDFFNIYSRTVGRQGLDLKPLDYFRKLVAILCARGQVSIFFAEYRARRLATALVVYFGRSATYFFGGSLAVHRRVMAPYLLQFEIMRCAKARGCDWYDLWGVAPLGATDDPWEDISVFKRKFGGMELNLVPTLDYVYDRAAYELYVSCVGETVAA